MIDGAGSKEYYLYKIRARYRYGNIWRAVESMVLQVFVGNLLNKRIYLLNEKTNVLYRL